MTLAAAAKHVSNRATARVGGPEHAPIKVWEGDKGTVVRTPMIELADYPDERFGVGHRCPHCDSVGTYRKEIPGLLSGGVGRGPARRSLERVANSGVNDG